jgi:MYXO-CTERM domain-containing protein
MRVGESTEPECTAFDLDDPSATLAYAWYIGDDATAFSDRAHPAAQAGLAAGTHRFRCVARNPSTGLSSQDQVEVQVRTVEGLLPPRILSTGKTEACVGQAYLYSDTRRAAARGSAPLTWLAGRTVDSELVGKPDGFGIDPGTGIIDWTPTAAQVGQVPVVLTVANQAGLDVQELEVTVRDCSAPVAPPKEGAVTHSRCGCRGSDQPVIAALLVGVLWLTRRRRSA